MEPLVILYIVIAVILLIGVSVAGSSHSYFNDTAKKSNGKISSIGITASDFASNVINQRGLKVSVARTTGEFRDFYDPKNKVIAISEDLYSSYSVVAMAVTSHELGHAISDAGSSTSLNLKLKLAKICKFLNWLVWPLLIASLVCYFVIEDLPAIYIGLLTSAGVIFALGLILKLVTLRTEKVASKIGIDLLKEYNLAPEEIKEAKRLLNAAYITYVGDIFMPFVKILRFIGFILYNTIGRLLR